MTARKVPFRRRLAVEDIEGHASWIAENNLDADTRRGGNEPANALVHRPATPGVTNDYAASSFDGTNKVTSSGAWQWSSAPCSQRLKYGLIGSTIGDDFINHGQIT